MRLALALGAVGLVGAVVGLLLWSAIPVGPVAPARNPFGTGFREAAPSGSGLGGLLLAWQASFVTALRGAVAALKADGAGWPLLVGIGFAYGVFHAAGPGHGKAIIAAYIVSSERAVLRGLALSAAAALIQALVAIGLVTVIFLLIGGTAATMGRAANVVELSGFVVVTLLGAALVWRKAGGLAALATPSAAAPTTADDACACGHVDPKDVAAASWLQMAGVAVGAGIRPCAGAILILTFARVQGVYAAGILATVAMALGTALTTGALALVSLYAKRAALRLASGRGRSAALAGAGAELAAAALVVVIGLALLAGVWEGGGRT